MSETWNDLVSLETAKTTRKESDQNLLLVDGNNLGYRYIQRKNFNSFQDDYYRTIESLASSYNCKDIVVAFDYGKSKYRLDLHPEYKATRKKPETPEDIDHFEQFFAELNKVQKELPFENFKIFGVEADDIIAYLTQQLYDRYPHIWIVSSDRDIYQLLNPNISIFNIFSRIEITVDWLQQEKQLTPSEYVLSRIIQGDSGDNIKGIEGIGEKRGQDLAKSYKTLANLIKHLPLKGKSKYINNLNNGIETLVRNKHLIDLTSDPSKPITYEKPENILPIQRYVTAIQNTYPLLAIDNFVNSPRKMPVDVDGLKKTGVVVDC